MTTRKMIRLQNNTIRDIILPDGTVIPKLSSGKILEDVWQQTENIDRVRVLLLNDPPALEVLKEKETVVQDLEAGELATPEAAIMPAVEVRKGKSK